MVFSELSRRLVHALQLDHPPVAVTFDSDDADRRPSPEAEPAGCCFWIPAEAGRIDTRADDHSPCSVGSYTHGFLGLAAAAGADDVAALVSTGWVEPAHLNAAARLSWRPRTITYQPLAEAANVDVVLVRLSARGVMTLAGTVQDLSLITKPQCQIVPLAAAGQVAVSPGCAVSRARTDLPDVELTCALPGARLDSLTEDLEASGLRDHAAATMVSAKAANSA